METWVALGVCRGKWIFQKFFLKSGNRHTYLSHFRCEHPSPVALERLRSGKLAETN